MKPSFSMELESLYDKRKVLLERKKDFFEGEDPFYGDGNYQEICSEIDNISQQINEIEDNFDTETDSLFDNYILDEDIVEDNDIDFLEDNITIEDF